MGRGRLASSISEMGAVSAPTRKYVTTAYRPQAHHTTGTSRPNRTGATLLSTVTSRTVETAFPASPLWLYIQCAVDNSPGRRSEPLTTTVSTMARVADTETPMAHRWSQTSRARVSMRFRG